MSGSVVNRNVGTKIVKNRNRIRENAEQMAAKGGVEIEFIRKRNFRKEDRVKEIIAKRGEQAGLVCIFSAMEPCSTYKP